MMLLLYRIKSSLLGILGSCLTVLLVYHIFKLGIKETYVQHLDSTEITNYTLLESLLLTDSNNVIHQYENQSTDTATISSINYSLEQLKTLASTASLPSIQSVSVILQYHFEISFRDQIDSVLRQTINLSFIYIVCTKQDKPTVDQLIADKEQEYQRYGLIRSVNVSNKQGSYWFSGIGTLNNDDTDFVFILDGAWVQPGEKYFDFTLRLLQAPFSPFEHTLVGTEQGLEDGKDCRLEASRARYVRQISDIWLLRREWLLALLSDERRNDTNKSISRDLYQALDMPSILLPSSVRSLQGNTFNSSIRDCEEGTDERNASILFYMDQQSSSSLEKLICQFSTQHEIIHLATMNEENIKPITCYHPQNTFIMYHTMAESQNGMFQLVYQLSASVVIYEESTMMNLESDFLKSSLSHTTTALQLTPPTFIRLSKLNKELLPNILWMAGLPIKALEQWHVPSIKLIITTSGNKKLPQVKRLLNSLKHADYLGDKQVDLTLLMDEKSDRLTSQYINNLQWTIGRKQVHHRIAQVHPMQIFTEAWYPSDNHEYAVMLDDRLELSPFFYVWLKHTILKYRYSAITINKQVFGISLYSPRIIDTDTTGRLLFKGSNSTKLPYLMQIPSSSGALYFPEHWREFHDYITARLTDQAIVKRGSGQRHLLNDFVLRISRSNLWTNSWRKYFDEMTYMRGYLMLYPPHQTSYSTVHLMPVKKKNKARYLSAEKLYNVPLSRKVVSQQLPDMDALAIFDLHGKLVQQSSRLIERGLQLQRTVSACEPRPEHNHDPSDMLCPFSHLIQIPIEASPTEIPIKSVNIYVG
ncbi:MAG: hypothetical protein EXX96DRAFT_526440 [Benjaminiella poitrasii]|nr:MAG: hypothetical protein EXX96DRAFT_526440 [Benjaminiella poitrasii]